MIFSHVKLCLAQLAGLWKGNGIEMMMRKKSFIIVGIVTSMILALTGCGGSKLQELTGDEAREALDNAQKLYFTGDLKDVNAFSDIAADDKIAGQVEETGFFNSKYTVSIDGKDIFYIADPAENDPVDAVEDTYSTHEYYDMDGNCLGYAQERLINGDYNIAFINPDGSLKDYYTDTDVKNIYNMDSEQIGTITTKLSNWYSDNFYIQIDTPESNTDVDFYDKIYMYEKNVGWANDEYDTVDD